MILANDPTCGYMNSKSTPKYTPKTSNMTPKQLLKNHLIVDSSNRGLAAWCKTLNNLPSPGLVLSANSVQDAQRIFKIFEYLRTCSLRPPLLPLDCLVLPPTNIALAFVVHFGAAYAFGLMFDFVFVSLLAPF